MISPCQIHLHEGQLHPGFCEKKPEKNANPYKGEHLHHISWTDPRVCCPHLGPPSNWWHPTTGGCAARFVLNKPHYHPEYHTASVTNMLHQLEWPILLHNHQQSEVTLLIKVQNNLVAIPAEYRAQPLNPRALLRCPHQLVIPWSEIELHSATRLFNILLNDIGSAASTNPFKALIAQHFHLLHLQNHTCTYVDMLVFMLRCCASF